MLAIFINIQNELMYLDYLTGLNNRRQLDLYLQELIQKNKSNTIFAGIMLDLNSFKAINDLYGHYIGDQALQYMSQILKKSFNNKAFISRFGGDEFVVLLELNNRYELEKIITLLKDNVMQFNSQKSVPYKLNISIGADYYDSRSPMSAQEFLMYIDALMYKNKLRNLNKMN